MRGALACVLAAIAVLVAGCAVNTPRETFYTLDAAIVAPAGASASGAASGAGAAGTATSAGAPTLAVFVEPARVPELVDRPQMIVSTGDAQVVPLEQQRWAEPLRAQIARVVALDLARALPSTRVSANDYVLDGVDPSKGYRVTLDVQRFETRLGDAAAIEVAWTVRRANVIAETDVVASGRERVREPATEPGYDGVVRAHNRALASVGRTIAAALRAAAGAGN